MLGRGAPAALRLLWRPSVPALNHRYFMHARHRCPAWFRGGVGHNVFVYILSESRKLTLARFVLSFPSHTPALMRDAGVAAGVVVLGAASPCPCVAL